MTEAEETAKFIDTGKTIVHRGRTYAILQPPPDDPRASEGPYILRSERGKWYALTRNRPNPTALFGIGLYGTMKVLPGWFTDKNGELTSLG